MAHGVFALRLPVLGSIGDRTQWRSHPPCPSCGRSTRLAERLHFMLNHWEGHSICRLTWHLLIAPSFAQELERTGAIIFTHEIDQEYQLEPGSQAPEFRLMEPGPIIPNRLKRQCSACNVSYENDSAWVRLLPKAPAAGSVNPSGALLFDTDVPSGPALFLLGRDHFAITSPLQPLFAGQPDIALTPVPVVRNPVDGLGPSGPATGIPASW